MNIYTLTLYPYIERLYIYILHTYTHINTCIYGYKVYIYIYIWSQYSVDAVSY